MACPASFVQMVSHTVTLGSTPTAALKTSRVVFRKTLFSSVVTFTFSTVVVAYLENSSPNSIGTVTIKFLLSSAINLSDGLSFVIFPEMYVGGYHPLI